MSDLPPEEVPAAVEPVPIGLPKALAILTQAQLADTLRKWRKDEPCQSPDGQ